MEQEQFKKEILPLREKLFLYARRLLDNPEDAEDVMQEVFLKLWYMRGELDYYNNVMALSVQITKHLCLNRMKVRERTEGEADEQFFICDANTYLCGRNFYTAVRGDVFRRIISSPILFGN